jgi:bifunctional dethiobiotin synthetase / adenosylmethionine---8-amino-7-oxononanoate aminotransferase
MTHLGTSEEQIVEGSHQTSLSSHCHAKLQNGNLRNVAADSIPSSSHLTCTTMWSWYEPVSPHLAAEKERATVDDSCVLSTLTNSLQSFGKMNCDSDGKAVHRKWAIVETAGGVASPGPSGTLQCDLYRYSLESWRDLST